MADIFQSILRRLRDLYNNPQASMEQVADNLRNASRQMELYTIPGSEGFYRKQKGWVDNQDDGISKFQRKARGGLVQYSKECSCHGR